MKRNAGMDRSITKAWRPATQAVRGGTWRSEHGETSEALFLTSGYTYDDAATVAARFAGEQTGMTYSRLQNPTVEMLEERIALLEGAEACRAQATGMAAMTTALLCQLNSGDHVVAAKAAFGSCRWLTDNLLPRWGITTTTIDATDNAAWEAAIQPNTKVFFFETPANPTMGIVDLAYVCGLAKAHGITTVVDNAFATSALQRPMDFGADVVAYSATKMMDGQGRVLAGAVCGSAQFMEEKLLPFQRNTGPNCAPFNAWVVLKGLETLSIRMRAQSERALQLANWLEQQPQIERVFYPGLQSHPQHELAMAQQSGCGGAVLSFTVKARVSGDGEAEADAARRAAFHVIDSTCVCSITANLGDTKTTITHPASTSHGRLTEVQRQAAGITQGMVRVSVGLDDVEDLKDDLLRGLNSL
jgi:O-succinylhomoserine sulfhydrylase